MFQNLQILENIVKEFCRVGREDGNNEKFQ